MPTYQEYQEQIAKLQILAEAARKEELAGATKKIQELMQQYGVSIADLSSAKKTKAKSSAKPTAITPKYKDPESGQTWSGRGRTPAWLTGKDKDKYLIG